MKKFEIKENSTFDNFIYKNLVYRTNLYGDNLQEILKIE